MIRHVVYMVQNDTGPPIDFEILNDDAVYNDDNELVTPATPFDLTGCTVRFKITSPRKQYTNVGHPVCIITDAENGKCRYNFAGGDIPVAGRYQCDVEVTNASNIVQTEYTVTDIQVRSENA